MTIASMQPLESRTLLSASAVLHGPGHHVLVINGDPSTPNTIVVGLAAGGSQIDVTLNGGAPQTFTRSDVHRVRIFGGSQADTITIDETNGKFPIRTFIDARAGNDTVTGGNANEVIVTGKGADSVTVGDGNDFILGHGTDTIVAGNGNDVIVGGVTNQVGSDLITVGNGNDTVFGLAGNDTITLGNGNDVVYAGADTINAGGGTDTIRETSHKPTINPGSGTVNEVPIGAASAGHRVHHFIDEILDHLYFGDL